MQGVHIPLSDNERRAGSSDFERLFGFLLPELPPYRWLIDSGGYSAFSWPEEWLLDAHFQARIDSQVKETPYGLIVDTAFLAAHMKYLTDFWIDLFGYDVSASPLPRRKWRVSMQGSQVSTQEVIEAPEAAQSIFHNRDGAYWQFFSRRSDLVQEVARLWPDAIRVEAV